MGPTDSHVPFQQLAWLGPILTSDSIKKFQPSTLLSIRDHQSFRSLTIALQLLMSGKGKNSLSSLLEFLQLG